MAVTFVGNSDFAQSAPAKWQTNGWDMDRLVVSWRGDADQLDDFIDGLSMWAASSIDGGMYLESYPNDGHLQFPTVDLTYIGKKGGGLPPAKKSQTFVTQQARYTSWTGKTWVEIDYNAPTTSKRIWDRDEIDISSIGAAMPVDAEVVAWKAYSEEGAILPASDSEALAFFAQIAVTTGNCEEVVPAQYFVATQNRVNMLFSIEA